MSSRLFNVSFSIVILLADLVWKNIIQITLRNVLSTVKTVAALHQGAPGQTTWLKSFPPWLAPWLAPWLPPWLTKISINFINIAHKQINLCATKCESRFIFYYTRSLLFVRPQTVPDPSGDTCLVPRPFGPSQL